MGDGVLPDRNAFTTKTVQGELRSDWDRLVDTLYNLPGAASYRLVEIVGDAIPAAEAQWGQFAIDGEGSVADDLSNLPVDRYTPGAIVVVKIQNETAPVTVKHNPAPGSGDIVNRITGADLLISALNQHVVMQRTGTFWSVIDMFGDELERVVGAVGEAQFQNGHAAGGDAPVYWRDRDGLVHFDGVVTNVAAHNPVGTLVMFSPLPVGYRPATQLDQLILRSSSAGSMADLLSVSTAGEVRIVNSISGDNVGTNVNVYLSGVVPFKGV